MAAAVAIAVGHTVVLVCRCSGGGGGGGGGGGARTKSETQLVAQKLVDTTRSRPEVDRAATAAAAAATAAVVVNNPLVVSGTAENFPAQAAASGSAPRSWTASGGPRTRSVETRPRPGAAATAAVTGRLTDEEKRAGLARMNQLRAQLTALPATDALPRAAKPLPPLVWSAEAERLAQDWADRCPSGHRPASEAALWASERASGSGYGTSYGENMAWSTNATLVSAVNLWDDERSLIDKQAIAAQGAAGFTYAVNSGATRDAEKWCRGGAGQCGHLTQQLAAATTSVGCARSTTPCGIPGRAPSGADQRSSPTGGGNVSLIVCNYSPPGNFIGRQVYAAAART